MKGQERRKFHRIEYDAPVNIKLRDLSYDSCNAGNLSLTGLFVQGDFPQVQGRECFVEFVRKDNPNHSFLKVTAKIVWSGNDGMGLEFTSIEHQNYMNLISTLINNAEQPAIILSEIPRACPYKLVVD